MNAINAQELLDRSSLNSFHKHLVFWTMFIIVFDGYDLVIYGSVLPVLMKAWNLTPVEAGSLASYALFGMLIGAFLFGSLGNKIGFRKAILYCLVLFSVFTMLCGFATGPAVFGSFRFLAGIGIGGVMPNTVALMAEYAPRKIRSTLITIMFSGIATGGILSVLVGMYLIPLFGWQAVFFVGLFPLLLMPFILRALPESIVFLVKKGRVIEALHHLKRAAPEAPLASKAELYVPETVLSQTRISDLFTQGRLLSTLMFWIAYFMGLLVIYGINSWLPKLIMELPDYKDNLSLSLTFLLVYNIGAVVGAIAGGRLGDRFNLKTTVILFFALAAVVIGVLGFTTSWPWLLYVLIFITGATTSGNQIVLNTLVAQYYPPLLRSSGFGWALGMGRIGAIIGPALIGFLVALHLSFEQEFMVLAIPAALACISIVFVNFKRNN